MSVQVPDLERKIARLQGRRTFIAESVDALTKEIGIARARQSYREPVEGVLDALEARFHARSLGVLEGLLTAFLHDVIAREEGPVQSVSLTMDTQRGLPALQIAVMNGEHPEDALNGRGGAVTNVLSAGLRFAALSRAGKASLKGFRFRPFLILDEADCWLRFSRVSDFSDVVYQMARDLGMQILMISHHPADMLKGYPVHLERETRTENGVTLSVPKARYVPWHEANLATEIAEMQGATNDEMGKTDGAQPPAGAQPRGFQSIRLIDFMAHVDTRIPLHPHVTILSGDNDIGKSAVTEAFRAICYNDASDMVIRHGAAQAEVILTLDSCGGHSSEDPASETQTLHWIRVAKGAPKVRYILKDENGDILKETPSPKEVPDWARNLMGVDFLEADGKDPLDVQIGHQKSPVFLLDKTPSQRAAILDMGQESQHLRRLRDQWKKQVDSDRRTIRDGEKKLADWQTALNVLNRLDDAEEAVTLYNAVQQRTLERIQAIRQRTVAVDALQRVQGAICCLETIPVPPGLPDRTTWSQAALRWRLCTSAENRYRQWQYWQTVQIPDATDLGLPTSTTQALFRRATICNGSAPMQKRMQIWLPWSPPILPTLPEIRTRSRAAMAKSARALWSTREILQGLSHLSVPTLTDLRQKTEWIFRSYKTGSEAQHLKKEMLDNEEALRTEESALQALQKEKEARLTEWGICPFCGHGHKEDRLKRTAT